MALYLCLLSAAALQGEYALRYLTHTGCPGRYLPHDMLPWAIVYQQWTRWRDAREFESIVPDLNELQRVLLARLVTPSAVVLDRNTLQSTPESGHRAGWDGAKRRHHGHHIFPFERLAHVNAQTLTTTTYRLSLRRGFCGHRRDGLVQ